MTTASIILGLIAAISMLAMGFAIHELASRNSSGASGDQLPKPLRNP